MQWHDRRSTFPSSKQLCGQALLLTVICRLFNLEKMGRLACRPIPVSVGNHFRIFEVFRIGVVYEAFVFAMPESVERR